MNCLYCQSEGLRTLETRGSQNNTIRRRKECLKCGKRITTYEYIESTPVYIIKKDGRREKFDRNKIKIGMIKALEKRPVSHDKIDEVLDSIDEKIRRIGKEEIESSVIGEYIMDALKDLDQVAYIRFASVYRSFADITSFEEEIKKLTEKQIVREK